MQSFVSRALLVPMAITNDKGGAGFSSNLTLILGILHYPRVERCVVAPCVRSTFGARSVQSDVTSDVTCA